jgi:hypothetical protein
MGTVASFKPRKGSAAAKRMMAAIRAGKSPKRHLKSVKSGGKRRRSRVRAVAVKARRSYRRAAPRALRMSLNGIGGMVTQAALGAGGAVVADIGFGYVKSFLPASMQTPQDLTTGGVNWGYFLAKAGVTIGLGMVGRKVSKHAETMAKGALLVQAYQAAVNLVPSGIQMGQFVGSQPRMHAVPTHQAPRALPSPGLRGYVPAAQREAALRNR